MGRGKRKEKFKLKTQGTASGDTARELGRQTAGHRGLGSWCTCLCPGTCHPECPERPRCAWATARSCGGWVKFQGVQTWKKLAE
jgi:hypothetical protein